MTISRRLLAALTLATALLVPAAAQAAPTGVNVSHVDDDGDPYIKLAGNIGAGDTAQTWSDLEQSGAKLVRTFVSWDSLVGGSRDLQMSKYRGLADKAAARGMRVAADRHRRAAAAAEPGPVRRGASPTSRASSGAATSPTRSGTSPTTRPSGTTARSRPQYAALLKAAYPAIKAADPAASVLVGGLVGNDFEFVERLYDNGAKGSFDGVGVHTDTACLTTDPREYYREPSGRIGRYSFTGYREVRATMLAHGDDKPVWMTELGWASTTADLRARRPRRHQGRRRHPGRAGRLPRQGLRLPGQRPLGRAGRLVQPARPPDGLDQRLAQPRPGHRRLRAQAGLLRLPARGRRGADRVRRHDGQRRPAGHDQLADRRPALPDRAAGLDLGHRRPGRDRHRLHRRRQGGRAQDRQERQGRDGEVRLGRREGPLLRPAHGRRDRQRRGQERRPRDRQGHPRRRRQVPLQGPDHASSSPSARSRTARSRSRARSPRRSRWSRAWPTAAATSPSRASTPRPSAGSGSAATARTPSTPSRLRYRFNKRGVWRVTGEFKPKAGFKGSRAKALEAEGQVARGQRSEPAISAASCATSVGVRPTRTPLASSASCLAAAVPAVPETIAPAWPIVLPGGAVKPAM